jgi:hypothetical protein
MHTGIISFCDRIAFNIKCSDAKDWILNELEKKYQIRILQKHWFKLDDQQFKYVLSIPHWACLRSNGNPYFVYFTRYEDVSQIMYIDKKVQPGYQKPRIILSKGQFSEEIFDNTLIEGEMVKDKNQQWVFLINDVLMYKGRYLIHEPLPKRIAYAYDMIKNHYNSDEWMDVCTYQVKKYFECSQSAFENMMLLSKDLPYTNRGIYFMPHNMKYKPKLVNFNDELIKNVFRKIKDNPEFQEKQLQVDTPVVVPTTSINMHRPKSDVSYETNEKMLWLRKTEQPDIYDMYEQENSLQKMGIASVPSLMLSKMLRAVFKNLNVATSVPFKCRYEEQFQKWIPVESLI